MKIEVDKTEFNNLQTCLVNEIVAAVHQGIIDLKLKPEQLEEVINTIAFNVCCAIDVSTHMKHKGKRVLPVLTFAKSADFDHVVTCGSSSFMHEYVHDLTVDLLARKT